MLDTMHIGINIQLFMENGKNIAKDLITNGYGASSSGGSFNTVLSDLVTQHLNKETKGDVGPFRSGYIRHPYSKKIDKTYMFTARCEHFTTGQEIDKEVVDGLFRAELVGNKHFEAFLLEKLLEDKRSFFEPLLVVRRFAKLLVYLLTN